MPVLATIAAISLLRGSGGGPAPFFEPDTLREMLTNALEGSSSDELQVSLAIVDQIESALARYRGSVAESTDAYAEELSDPKTNAADLIERLEPLDRKRVGLMQAIIDSRQQLLSVLGDELWDTVFKD